jgi:hypothetical protein
MEQFSNNMKDGRYPWGIKIYLNTDQLGRNHSMIHGELQLKEVHFICKYITFDIKSAQTNNEF